MGDYELPKKLLEEYNAWVKEDAIPEGKAKQDEYKYVAYCKAIRIVKGIFGEDALMADNPNATLKSHVITVRITDDDISMEDENVKQFADVLKYMDYFTVGVCGDGKTIKMDLLMENIYTE